MTPEAFSKSVMTTVEWTASQLVHSHDAAVEAVLADLQERWTAGLSEVWRDVDQETLEAGARCIVVEVGRGWRRCGWIEWVARIQVTG